MVLLVYHFINKVHLSLKIFNLTSDFLDPWVLDADNGRDKAISIMYNENKYK
jgi:hypothetical protein